MSPERPLVRQLAEFAVDARDGGIPLPVALDMSRRVRDIVGLALAAGTTDVAAVTREVARRWGGHEHAGVIGRTERLPAPSAALVNGTLAHALDFDDTHLPSVLHPSAAVVPAALAAGEYRRCSGDTMVAAAAAGVEVCVRLGMASYDHELGNSVYFERGLHATSICGTVGAAVAAGLLNNLDASGLSHAIAIACSFGAGLLEANRTGGTVKRVHCGWAAHAGVAAADLAAAGLSGPPTVFEGRFGFLQAFGGDADPGALTRGLGTDWEVPTMFFKPYPANHFTHGGIDAALQLRALGLTAEDLADVEMGVATPTLRTIAEPAELKARPSSGYAAQFSGPFTFATAMTGGGGLGVYLDDFDEFGIHDERRLTLAAKVRCVGDPACDAIFPRQFPTIVRVTTTTGDRHEIKVLANRGGPDNPLSAAELATKFRLNASQALDNLAVRRLDTLLSDLREVGDVRDITRASVAPGPFT